MIKLQEGLKIILTKKLTKMYSDINSILCFLYFAFILHGQANKIHTEITSTIKYEGKIVYSVACYKSKASA
jgi:hypothetical protein